ncbi:DNA primase small subunit [Trichinella spiralis]|uniref:DNA primase small subunit n=1 Tax=Trichinella spiralis TaxID=6334 RepID=UPI0001EFB4C2|nr:DNA primase small subunit [Trichinella spiralis]
MKLPSGKDYGSTVVGIEQSDSIYGGGPCWYLFISIVLFICLVDARILPAKRELGKRDNRDGGSQTENMIAQTNPPVVTSASSPSDDRDSSRVGVTNEPARESGS